MPAQDENDGDILFACPRGALAFDLARAFPDAVVVAFDERERSLAPSSSAGTSAVDTGTPPSQRESSSLAMVINRHFKAGSND